MSGGNHRESCPVYGSAVGGIYATRDHNDVTNVLRNIKKKETCIGSFRTKVVEC
jgi:hypothetical protein